MSALKIHFVGTSLTSRAACGRLVLVYRSGGPQHTDDRSRVTCVACLAAMRKA